MYGGGGDSFNKKDLLRRPFLGDTKIILKQD